MKLFQLLIENIIRFEPDISEKAMAARKHEIIENIVKTICAIYHACSQEVYNLYSNNGTHVHDHEKE